MSKLFEREYYRIVSIVSDIGYTADDLIHLAANGKIRLGVLFEVDGFFAEEYMTCEKHTLKRLVGREAATDFSGFAYVDQGYFMHMERNGGDLIFNGVELIDGRLVMKIPGGGTDGSESRSIEQIFIHATELKNLLGESNKKIDRSNLSDKLAKMNQASMKFWGNADRNDRGTHPDNATVAAWLVNQGFSSTLASKAATIIRPKWAPTGRKPEE